MASKRDPWVVIDLMTNEHVERFATEKAALQYIVANKDRALTTEFWR